MKKVLIIVMCVGMLVSFTSIANATVLLFDTFDAENGGIAALNYSSFTNWAVTEGTVDLIGDGSSWQYLPVGNGLYVDLDGSTRDAGLFTTKTVFDFTPGNVYTLSFDLAGNNVPYDGYPSDDTVEISVALGGVFSENITKSRYDMLETYTRTITVSAPTSGSLRFANMGGDNVGLLLDNVKLECTPVPEPATALLSILGVAGFFVTKKFF